MIYTFFFPKINFDIYLSFEHFLNQIIRKDLPVIIKIYIAETDGDLDMAKKIFYRFKNDVQLQKHQVKTYIYSASTAGLFIALTADYKDRKIWQYGTLQYRLFAPEHPNNKFKIFDNLFLMDDELSEFQQTLDVFAEYTKLDLDSITRYDGKVLVPNDYPVSRLTGGFYAEKNKFTLLLLAQKMLEENNVPYYFPEIIQRKIKKFLNNYSVGIISKKECANQIADSIY